MKHFVIPNSQVERAAWIIDNANLPDLLAAAIDKAPQGAKPGLSLRTWLIGCYLAVDVAGSFKNVDIYRVLRAMRPTWRKALGVDVQQSDGQWEPINRSKVDYISRHLPRQLSWTATASQKYNLNLAPEEMRRREAAVRTFVDALVSISVIDPSDGWYALDGSGTWSWGRSKFKVKDSLDIRDVEETTPDRTPDEVLDATAPAAGTDEATATTPATGQEDKYDWTLNHDPDARIGSKTAKTGGRQPYYGYVIDAAISIRKPGGPKRPVLLEAFRLSPANADVVGPTLELLDRLIDTPGGVTDIVVDRHYPHKHLHRWADQLVERGVNQHFDMRSNEHGYVDVNGAKLVNGWMHCPETPEHLAVIQRPGPTASKAERNTFDAAIAERQQYAMARIESVTKPSNPGRTKWRCPARAGKIGCPLIRGTVEAAHRTPGVRALKDVPDANKALACCSQDSWTDRSDRMRKHQQPHYWGSPEWQEVYDLRTYVEGFFGSLKNRDTENLSRGFTKFVGLPMMTIGIAFASAACNVRHQRKFWADDPSAPDHPLLQPDPEFAVVADVTDENDSADHVAA